MSPTDEIPGWGGGVPEVADPARRGIAERLSEAFRLYRANFGALVRITALTQGIAGIPLAILAASQFTSGIEMVSRIFSGKLYDTNSLYPGLVGPFDDPGPDSALWGVASGLSLIGLAFAISAIVRVILTPSVAEAGAVALFRVIRPRSVPLIAAAILVIDGFGLVFWLQGGWVDRIGSFDPSDPGATARIGSATGLVLAGTLVLICAQIAAVYAAVRWAVAIPAYVVLGRTARGALARSSLLTKGRRLSILGLLIVTGIIVSLASAAFMYLPVGIAYGAGWGSALGALLSLVGFSAGLMITTPLLGIIIAILYRDLQTAGPRRVLDVPDASTGWVARQG